MLAQPDQSTYVGLRDFTAMCILLGTGIRISELIGLRVGDFDFVELSLTIRKAKARKGRVVGIPVSVVDHLKYYFDSCTDGDLNEPAFQSTLGGNISTRRLQENIKEYGKDAEISGVKVSPHTFRRTFAITYLRNGGSTSSLRQQLGHNSLQVVEKYLYWSDESVLDEHKKYNPFDSMDLSDR